MRADRSNSDKYGWQRASEGVGILNNPKAYAPAASSFLEAFNRCSISRRIDRKGMSGGNRVDDCNSNGLYPGVSEG